MRYRQSPLTHVLLAALGVLLIAGSVVAVLWLGRRANRQVDAVVAVRAIPPLHAIAPGDLAVRRVPFPVAAREGGFATNPAGFTGRLTSYGILAGAVLHPGELMPASLSETALDALLQQVTRQTGKPMVAVPVSLGQSQGFTLPAAGDRVTLFATVSAGQGGGGSAGGVANGPQAAVIVSRARVLSVLSPGGASSGPTVPFATGGGVQTPSAATSGVLVLALTPTQAQRVVLAEHAGQFTLVLDVPQCSVGGKAIPCGRTPPAAMGMGALVTTQGAESPRALPATAGHLPAAGSGAAPPAIPPAVPQTTAVAKRKGA